MLIRAEDDEMRQRAAVAPGVSELSYFSPFNIKYRDD